MLQNDHVLAGAALYGADPVRRDGIVMSLMSTPGAMAYEAIRGNAGGKFPIQQDDPRARDWLLFPVVTPSFHLAEGDTVFTIGSCFARNIEEALAENGINVPTMEFSTPRSEITETGRANKALNQYNAGTMLQCLREITEGVSEGGLLIRKDGLALDALLDTGGFPVTIERAGERREEIRALYADALPKAKATIVTLGLTEAWFDRDAGLYLNVAPNPQMVKNQPDRFEFVRLQYPEVKAMVTEIVDRIVAAGCPNVLLSISPVPLGRTFSSEDCIVANGTSKATLRTVAGELAASRDNVDYFPSYEIVLSGGLRSFQKDRRHVRPDVVNEIVKHMLTAYMPPT